MTIVQQLKAIAARHGAKREIAEIVGNNPTNSTRDFERLLRVACDIDKILEAFSVAIANE